MAWPFGPDDEPTKVTKKKSKKKKTTGTKRSKAPTLEQKETLIRRLKFTPITVDVQLYGYGGEIVAGRVPAKAVKYFRDNNIDLSNYAYDCDNELDVPEEFQPFRPGDWHECDDIFHENSVEMHGACMIEITTADSQDLLKCSLDTDDLLAHKVETECNYCIEFPDDLSQEKPAFYGYSYEKGTFWTGEIHLTEPFDPKKLRIYYQDIDGIIMFSSMEYAGKEVEDTGGYSTNGKGSDFKFLPTGDYAY